MAIRPFDWAEEYHRSGAYPTAVDLQMSSELGALSDFLSYEENMFTHDWWTIMLFAIDKVQDERVITVLEDN